MPVKDEEGADSGLACREPDKNPVGFALDDSYGALSEYDAKRFLTQYGIPVCREALVANPEAAVAEAVRIGFPVVVKV